MKRILTILTLSLLLTAYYPTYKVVIPSNTVSNSYSYMTKHIGLKETTGRNDGEHIKAYHSLIGLNYVDRPTKSNYPYCQMAQSYWLWQGNDSTWNGIEAVRTAGTRKAFNNLKQRSGKAFDSDTIAVNSLIYWGVPRSVKGHVERTYTQFINAEGKTVGANTSNGLKGSQRDGNGIFIRKRNLNSRYGKLLTIGVIVWDMTEEKDTICKVTPIGCKIGKTV